jgi:O-antigen ligase
MIQSNSFFHHFFDFIRRLPRAFELAAKILLVAVVFFIPLHSPTTKTLIYLFLLAWFFSGGYIKKWQLVRGNPFLWVSMLLYLAVYIGSFYGESDERAANQQLRAYAPVLLPIFITPLFQELQWRRQAFYAFMASMALTLFLSMLHVLWPLPWSFGFLNVSPQSANVFKSHITQNVMMSIFLLGCLLMFRTGLAWWKKALILIFSMTAVVNITFFVIGRTGYLTLLVSLLVVYIFVVPKLIRWRIAVLVWTFLFLIIAYSPNLMDRFLGVFSEIHAYQSGGDMTSSGARLEYWGRSLELLKQKPMWGFGTGSWTTEFCRVSRSEQWCNAWSTVHPHNQFLHLGVQLGGLGLLCLIFYFAVSAKLSWAYKGRDRAWLLGLWGALLVMSMVDVPLYIIDESRFFPVMLGVFLAGYRPNLQAGAWTMEPDLHAATAHS